MVTIRDVAEKANVSTTTVSHVINGTRYVSDELKRRVHEAMDLLNYQPNGLARSLRIGRSKTIGLILPDISNSFFAEISHIIEDFGFKNGYSVILCNTDDDPEKEAGYINVLINKHVDGIIFISACNPSSYLSILNEIRIPVVVVDRELPDINVDTVLNDNWLGGTLAADYLLKLGHRRIGCISGANTLLTSKQRVDGFITKLLSAGVTLHPDLLMEGDFHFDSGLACMNQILEKASLVSPEKRPTALFVCNDMMALGAIRSIQNHGLRVPEDISILGFDNVSIGELISPPLTTIAQPKQDLAGNAITVLLQKMKTESNKDYKSQRVIVQPYLVERESCIPWKSDSLNP